MYDEGIDKPIAIDAHVVYEYPLDTAIMKLDTRIYSRSEIEQYMKENNIEDQTILADLIEEFK
ncbi:hypothetical protein ABGF48_05905 [Helcococcus bovis]|uniref:hypothetical protein n=1 Tax=Helcococcus bovis TaxID=3153252 RepID=UPI0038BA8812